MTDIANNNAVSRNLTILGIDVGTSGIRGVIVKREGEKETLNETLLAEASITMPFPSRKDNQSEQSPHIWLSALETLLRELSDTPYLSEVTHLIVDATSSTVLLTDCHAMPLTPALMYDDKRAQTQAKRIADIAPKESGAHGASSTLAKVMWLEEYLEATSSQALIHHQADWINHYLCGEVGITDENNALKLGYDSVNQIWPDWLNQLTDMPLPKVVTPGSKIGQISPGLVEKYGFLASASVHAGTTDSIAAFLASGANQQGDAVVSLGSTLAIKLLSDKPVFAPDYGIYSHYVQGNWLVGGASNAGGAALLHHFELEQLIELLPNIDPAQPTNLEYYPLIQAGERFPIADANLTPKVTPRPESDAIFLQALLEGLTEIERLGFERLTELGAPAPKRLFSAGGGTKNTVWMQLRQAAIQAEFCQAESKKAADAAFGVTRLITS